MSLAQRKFGNRWTVAVLDHSNQGRLVAQAIIQGSAWAISDGSFKDEMGTSATVLYGIDKSKHIISVNDIPGNREEQSAYRSELAGIEGALAIIESLCQVHGIQAGSITIGLDWEPALHEQEECRGSHGVPRFPWFILNPPPDDEMTRHFYFLFLLLFLFCGQAEESESIDSTCLRGLI
jgi:hypothetical protein